MNPRRFLSRAAPVSGALAAATFFAIAGSATAAVLPNAVSYEYFGLNFAQNIATSNTVGTLDYGGRPGCGGVCIATTALGASPSVSAAVNEVSYFFTGGGGVQASLGYYVEYLNAPGAYTINLHAIDSLYAPDGRGVTAHLKFGLAGPQTALLGNFASTVFEEADCLNFCAQGGFAIPTGPFIPDHQFSIFANTLYYLQLNVLLAPTTSNVEIGGMIDPTFSTRVPGGQFIFSPGVFGGGAVPEPSTWALTILGLGMAGATLRRRAARRGVS